MKRYRLLIVDDEALIRSGLRARIAFFNFPDLDVDEAGSGARGAQAVWRVGIRHCDRPTSRCPDMNGLELVERAKALGARTRFVLLSGYAEFGYAQKAITLGVRAYLNKPVSNDALRAQIEELLEELRAEEADSGRASAPDPEKELNQILSEGLRGGKPEDAYPALWSRCPEAFGGGWFYPGHSAHHRAVRARAGGRGAKRRPRGGRTGAVRLRPAGGQLLSERPEAVRAVLRHARPDGPPAAGGARVSGCAAGAGAADERAADAGREPPLPRAERGVRGRRPRGAAPAAASTAARTSTSSRTFANTRRSRFPRPISNCCASTCSAATARARTGSWRRCFPKSAWRPGGRCTCTCSGCAWWG